MMPDGDPVDDSRERIAFHRALHAFEDSLRSGSTLGGLHLAEPWFATGVGEIGLIAPGDRVVVAAVDINDMGSVLRMGALEGWLR